MHNIPYTAEDRLLCQFGRLLKLAFHENPLAKSGVSLPQLTLLDWVAINPGCNLRIQICCCVNQIQMMGA